MNNGVLAIAFAEAKHAAKDESTLEDRIQKAMEATCNHWMATNEDDQFRAAVGAVLILSDGEDKERLEAELHNIKTLNAMLGGVIIDPGSLTEMDNPVGLMNMWNKVKGKS